MSFLNVTLILGVLVELIISVVVGFFQSMDRILSKAELVLVQVFHPVFLSSECFWAHFLHRGVVFTGLLVLTEIEAMLGWLQLALLVGGLIMDLHVPLIVVCHLGVDLLVVGLLLFLSVLELTGLELMNLYLMGLKLEYPMGMGILFIAAMNILKPLP